MPAVTFDPEEVFVECEPMSPGLQSSTNSLNETASDGNLPPSPTITERVIHDDPSIVYRKEMLEKALQYVDDNGDTLLHHAIRSGDIIMIQELLDYGADPFLHNRNGKSPFSLCFQVDFIKDETERFNIRHVIWNHVKSS